VTAVARSPLPSALVGKCPICEGASGAAVFLERLCFASAMRSSRRIRVSHPRRVDPSPRLFRNGSTLSHNGIGEESQCRALPPEFPSPSVTSYYRLDTEPRVQNHLGRHLLSGPLRPARDASRTPPFYFAAAVMPTFFRTCAGWRLKTRRSMRPPDLRAAPDCLSMFRRGRAGFLSPDGGVARVNFRDPSSVRHIRTSRAANIVARGRTVSSSSGWTTSRRLVALHAGGSECGDRIAEVRAG